MTHHLLLLAMPDPWTWVYILVVLAVIIRVVYVSFKGAGKKPK